MSLRTRLTLAVAAIVAIAVVVGASATLFSTGRELRAEVDAFLVERAERFVRPAGAGGIVAEIERERPRLARRGALVGIDAPAQVIGPAGRVLATLGADEALPVEDVDRRVASGGAGVLRDVTIAEDRYRMITAPLPGFGAVQIARSLDETDAVLDSLRSRFVVIALLGTAAAALVAWVLARRVTRPIEELTRATERIAATADLVPPLPVESTDEVGRLAASFNAMLAALGTSREQQRRLVADAGHELRTPLTALRTNIEVLARTDALGADERQELLDEAMVELDELGELVAELVELASDSRADEAVDLVDLADVVAAVVARVRRRTDRPITLDVDAGGVVRAQPSRLDRAIANLVDNAVKFSPPDVPVDVVAVGGRVTVADRGPGIPDADRERVFDRFYRADTARGRPGSGLGLAIVAQVASAHGGRAWAAARDGGGAEVSIELPLADVPSD